MFWFCLLKKNLALLRLLNNSILTNLFLIELSASAGRDSRQKEKQTANIRSSVASFLPKKA
jgi:hypothetical protein